MRCEPSPSEDVLSTIDYLINLEFFSMFGRPLPLNDIPTHLGKYAVCARWANCFRTRFRLGLNRLEANQIKERTERSREPNRSPPAQAGQTKPFGAAIKEFFASSQLSSSWMQTNRLAELTHKRGSKRPRPRRPHP